MIGSAFGLLLGVTLSGVQMLNASAQPMRATLSATAHGAALRQDLLIREYGGGAGAPIQFYDRDMTKKLHLIVVDSSLRTFMHVHPALQPDGALTLQLTFPHGGEWHLYADGIPHNFNRQVFRFDLTLNATGPAPAKRPTSQRRAVYSVTLDRTSLPAGKLSMVHVRVFKNDKPATDLRPYLGARAHAVIIGTDLSYIHAHAMAAAMGAMPPMGTMAMPAPKATTPGVVPSEDPCGQDADVGMSMVELPPHFHVQPDMMLMLQPQKPGRYHVWIQFRGADGVHTVPLMLMAR